MYDEHSWLARRGPHDTGRMECRRKKQEQQPQLTLDHTTLLPESDELRRRTIMRPLVSFESDIFVQRHTSVQA